MLNKTCGECKWFVLNSEGRCLSNEGEENANNDCCSFFEAKVITNGDRIRRKSNEELVGFLACSACIYAGHDCANQDCTEGKLEWLNAPAESEGEDEL